MEKLLSEHLLAHREEILSHTMVHWFRQAVQWYPDKTFVMLDNASMTYRAAERCSDKLAWYLTEQAGIVPGDVVAVCTGRSASAIVIILGIWKAGATFVVLDPDCPSMHNQECMESGKIRLCITFDYFASAISSCEHEEPFEDRSDLDRLALILYTSGSTGKPKGIRIKHSNIAASVSNFESFSLCSDDRFASLSNLTFIAAVFDFCVCMLLGCTLQILPARIRRNIGQIADFYKENGSTIAFLPPHMAVKYMKLDADSPLRVLLVGSEPARNLDKRPYDIINVYASSEACALASCYHIHDRRPLYPIGQPVPTLRWYIVTEEGKLAEPGEMGELWLSGPQICEGYQDLPDLNRLHFTDNPFCFEAPFTRVYHTADMVRQLPDGNLEFVARADTMYKIRGFRVEAECVETQMLLFPGIQEACVTCFADAGGTNILFGYYIADQQIDRAALRAFLAERLPRYAVPTALIQMDSFPRTRTGKPNRKGFTPPPELNDYKHLKDIY